MKLQTKIGKAFRKETYLPESAVRRLKEIRASIEDAPGRLGDAIELRLNPELRQAYEGRLHAIELKNLLKPIDEGALARIRADYGDGSKSIWAKYLDINKWLQRNADYVKDLGLVRHPPKAVLDLGCGAGFFLFVLKQMGAEVLGVDLDDDPIFNEMVKLLGIERIGYRITRQIKMPDFNGRKFDLITAWMVCFNNFDRPETLWNADDWDFLLRDLHRRLSENGRLLLSLNAQPDGKLYNEDVRRLFVDRSKLMRGKMIVFTKDSLGY